MFRRSSILAALALFGLALAEEAPLVLPVNDGEPATNFRELGRYRVTSGTNLALGKASDVPRGEMTFQVFTDGIDLRLCPDGEPENFLVFQIYRNGGIYDESGENLLPGVMALSDQGEVVRHLCIEPRVLVLTKFPTLSSELEVTYALRAEEL